MTLLPKLLSMEVDTISASVADDRSDFSALVSSDQTANFGVVHAQKLSVPAFQT